MLFKLFIIIYLHFQIELTFNLCNIDNINNRLFKDIKILFSEKVKIFLSNTNKQDYKY